MIEEIYIPPVTPCCCAWTDLLGFSNLYTHYNWSLSALVKDYNELGGEYERGYIHFDRLHKLLMMTHMTVDPSYERVIAINDGVARNVDLEGSMANPLPFLCWIRETIFKHELYCKQGIKNGFPGVRTTIAIGERTDFGFENTTMSDFLRKQVQPNDVIVYSPRPFQNNLAFAKAYLIETSISASRKTDERSNYFIESDFLSFLVKCLDGQSFTVPRYYEFDDDTFSGEPEQIAFSAEFAGGTLEVSGSIREKKRNFLKLLFDAPISVAARGLSTEVLELITARDLLLEDYKGPIYRPEGD